MKLPTLSLPRFSGVNDEWLTFSDLFQAAITNNQNLTGAQKLQYLKGVLKGDAQKIVQSLLITDGNFQIAWDLLKERYFHKREILSFLMKKLMNILPITCEYHAQILKLVDSIKECVRLLETLDLKVEGTANIILMFIIQFKLDSTTRGWWKRSLDNEKIPSLSELLQFLSNHARSLMTEGYGVKRNIMSQTSIPRDANNSVLSASAQVFHPVMSNATNTDTGPNPPNVNNPSITSCSGFDSNSQVLLSTALVNVCDSFGCVVFLTWEVRLA
ncbi:DUF1758 domain-containing protein [Trichonephila inaurata madagascariensis]|uniref:DUF1758 domain-containing protein n=1 Tax=Trichonephila inaurata madagascariensis TaxID=2747483 RepID=A0A8X7C321_9ARAC|nr:DUF1758 domain-containing protein [Trichonephila inaurata madagascariensis]